MTEDVLGQLYEPFFTTKPEGEGTGLGLATVQGIVGQYGGTVVARSAEGRGTRMSVLLPLVNGHDEPDEDTTETVRLPSRRA